MSASASHNISSTSLDFGGIGVGSSSSAMTITFDNTNTSTPISFNSISATGDFSVTHTCSGSLDELSSCSINVIFTPTVSGAATGTLTISGQDPFLASANIPFTETISLSGTGLSGGLSLDIDSNSIDLGSVTVGTPSSSVSTTLSQTGNAPVDITAITTSSPFSQSNDCPSTLAVGGSCTISVNVTATSPGDLAGTLSIAGSAPQGTSTTSIALSATAAAAPITSLVVSPTSLNFADTAVDTTSDAQSITITNQGNTTVSTLSVSVTGDFTQTNNCSTSLSPTTSCTISVIAAPSTAGDLTGSVEIAGLSNSQAVAESVPLSVHATIANLTTSDTQLSFPNASIDTSSQPQVLTLTNQGDAPLTINSITTEGDFTQTNNCGQVIAAADSCDIQVVFVPQTEGAATGALNINTNSGLSRIALSGRAGAATLTEDTIFNLLMPYGEGNPNVISTSRAIADACTSGRISERMQEDCNDVVDAAREGNAATTMALSQITPESATKANRTAHQGSETQNRNLGSRITALRAGARGLSFQGLDLRIDDQNLPIELISQSYDHSQHGGGASEDNPLLDSKLGIFITGDISRGSRDKSDLESGLDFNTYGITLGLDYRISNQFILGGAMGYIDTNTELDNNTGEIDTQGYSLSLYGTYYSNQDYFIDFSASYGSNNFDQSRRIDYSLEGLAEVKQKLTADYDGNMFSLFVGSGYDFTRDAWTFGPRADLEYIKSDIDGFTEKVSDASADGGGWATRINATDQKRLTLKLGGKLSYTHSADWGVLIPYTRLDLLHEFKDDSQVISAHFISDPAGNTIRIESDDPDRNYMRLRLGTSAQFQNGMVGFVDLSTLLAHSDWSAHTLSIGFRTEF
ncbi:MAG: autotransporter domain-containing protein [Candidatus Thiodiazotropha sp.]